MFIQSSISWPLLVETTAIPLSSRFFKEFSITTCINCRKWYKTKYYESFLPCTWKYLWYYMKLSLLDKSLHFQWYNVKLEKLPKALASKFVQLDPDEDTQNFIRYSEEKSDWIFTQIWHSIAKAFLGWFMSQTSING